MRLGPLELTLILGVGLLNLVSWGLTIAALIDVIRVPHDSDYRAGNKLVWVLVLVFSNCIGALIYYALGRPQRRY